MPHAAVPILTSLVILTLIGAETQAVQIENDRYMVQVDPAAGTFSIVAKSVGKPVVTDGKLTAKAGTAKTVVLDGPSEFGRGKGIEITYADGARERIALHNNVPFVLFGLSLHGGAQDTVKNHLPTISAAVAPDNPAAELRTLGTGGLLPAAKNPGSYAVQAVVDPQTRRGVVAGWLTHDRGSGVVFTPVAGDAVRVQAQLDYGRLQVPAGKDVSTEIFLIGYFDDARLGLEAYADAIAKVYSIKLPPHHPGYCTWYMEKHAGACDAKHLAELSAYAAKNLKPFGFDFIQIDDGWQEGPANNGPKKNYTTHNPKGPYPEGMKAAADGITALGLTPGIWFMPFAGNYKDPYFKDHQDWFVKGPDGKPFETDWGGTCLDMTHPAARENLRQLVHRIGHDWGYKLFKLDGFWTGTGTRQIYVNDGYRDDHIGESRFSNPDKTNIEALRDGVKLIREAAGPGVFLLGCCVPQNMRTLGGSFGLLDAMRIGPDIGEGNIGSPHASRMWFLNGRVWWNDPDCVTVRAPVPLDRARLNASFTAIANNLFYNSDWMPDFPLERLEILRRCIPSHGLLSRPVDVFEAEPARIWHLADTRGAVRRDIVALYNWDKKPATITCPLAKIGLPAASEYVAFDFWAKEFIAPFKKTLSAELPAGSCRILAVAPVCEHPRLLSTSRHLTQGILDVAGERWDGSASVLSATSRVVAEDRYELRIVVPAGRESWRAAQVSVSAADQAAGVKTEFLQDGPRLRVILTSPTGREIQWQVRFTAGAVTGW